MENNRILQGVLGLLLGYNVVFFTAHLQGQARALAEALAEVQSLLNIFELIAVMVLFVDLVLGLTTSPHGGRCLGWPQWVCA